MNHLFLDSSHLQMVRKILKKHLAKSKVIAFGSRVMGNHKPHSDLDLCIIAETPLTFMQMAALKEDFSESNLPMRVDIVEWSSITPEFQQIIQNDFVEVLN